MNSKNERTFGTIIREARISAGLTMAQTAEEAGISKSLLRFWELDAHKAPAFDGILRLASVLELDPLMLAEAAGYDVVGALPSVRPYFRNKYPDLPEAAIQQITAITEKYGIDPNHTGPRPGEDEQ